MREIYKISLVKDPHYKYNTHHKERERERERIFCMKNTRDTHRESETHTQISVSKTPAIQRERKTLKTA